jgi:hypothetical protein
MAKSSAMMLTKAPDLNLPLPGVPLLLELAPLTVVAVVVLLLLLSLLLLLLLGEAKGRWSPKEACVIVHVDGDVPVLVPVPVLVGTGLGLLEEEPCVRVRVVPVTPLTFLLALCLAKSGTRSDEEGVNPESNEQLVIV